MERRNPTTNNTEGKKKRSSRRKEEIERTRERDVKTDWVWISSSFLSFSLSLSSVLPRFIRTISSSLAFGSITLLTRKTSACVCVSLVRVGFFIFSSRPTIVFSGIIFKLSSYHFTFCHSDFFRLYLFSFFHFFCVLFHAKKKQKTATQRQHHQRTKEHERLGRPAATDAIRMRLRAAFLGLSVMIISF